MRYTNSAGIPETIRRALIKRNDQYNAGKVDTSVTQLIQPPQITLLRKQHFREMIKEAHEDFWALLGSGVHSILELGASENMIVEERLFATVDGWRISGALDVQEFFGDEVDISDYKTTSVYSVNGDEPKKEWVEQLNIYAFLLELNKPQFRVRSLNIIAILRDWSGAKAKADPLYPQFPIMPVVLPLWSKKKQLSFIRERIAHHRDARFAHEMGDTLPECTPEERWEKDSKWAVFKDGNKRALKVCSTEEEALDLVKEKGDNHYVEHRPGSSVRCQYCGCNPWCEQYKRIASDGNVEGDTGV